MIEHPDFVGTPRFSDMAIGRAEERISEALRVPVRWANGFSELAAAMHRNASSMSDAANVFRSFHEFEVSFEMNMSALGSGSVRWRIESCMYFYT